MAREAFSIDGPAGCLDCRRRGSGDVVLLLHPHPAFEGSMGSRLIYDLAKHLAANGYEAVRFDFRGVGRSEGDYDHGDGEVQDAMAVFDEVKPRFVVGFSFGGGVALRLARHRSPDAILLVATPPEVTASNLCPMEDAADVDIPVHIVVGDEDPYVSVADAERLAGALPQGSGPTIIEGAGHFLEPSFNDQVANAVTRWLAQAS